jgi:hypothetical protein
MPGPLNGWQNVWFFLRNDADTQLPMFMGSRPIPQPNWVYEVVRVDLHRLQPLREVVERLQCGGLMDADLLSTSYGPFLVTGFNHSISRR